MSSPNLHWLSSNSPPSAFPPIDCALREPDGLLAAGGDLSRERLLHAYRNGIFPWYNEGEPILWWSPDPRCILYPHRFHVSRRLKRSLRREPCRVTFNQRFDAVMAQCAAPRADHAGTWITADMVRAYGQLHTDGWAHSVEVWRDEELIGGLYGLAIGRVFFGESMFSKRSNGSKIALLALCRFMRDKDLALLDCQVASPHLMSLGAELLPRSDFLRLLNVACEPRRVEDWPNMATIADLIDP